MKMKGFRFTKGFANLGLTVGMLLGLSAGAEAFAAQARHTGFVTLRRDFQMFVDYVPAERGQPTLVILNGLTYKTTSWDPMMKGLEDQGYGILRFDPRGHGQTLLRYAPVRYVISIEDQVRDMALLIKRLGIVGKIDILGLSYGGGMGLVYAARYPQMVNSLILMAPYVGPLEFQDAWIKTEVAATRLANPFNPATDDELYDYFLRMNVYATYPSFEPVVLENPYKLEATFRLVQGIRKIKASDLISRIPNGVVHLVVASQDQYVPRHMMDGFWSELPASKRVSRLNVGGSEHKLPEAVPHFSAGWVNLIMKRDPRLSGGRVFDANAWTGEVRSGSIKIKLPKG